MRPAQMSKDSPGQGGQARDQRWDGPQARTQACTLAWPAWLMQLSPLRK